MRTELLALAERCERATGGDYQLEREIGIAIGKPQCVSQFDGQTWRHYTSSLGAALTLAEPYMLVALSDIAADGITGCCLCSDTSASPPVEHWGVPSERGVSRTGILARAVCAAALRAKASEATDAN